MAGKRKKGGRKAGKAPPASFARRWFRRLVVLGLVGVVAGVGVAAGALAWYGRDLPRLISLDDYHPAQATRVYAADGRELALFARERRTVVPVDRIPEVVRNAVLAAEDVDFYRHKGLDYLALVRAVIAVARSGGRFTQGGSTITQQVVKTFLLTPEKTISRKLKEMILARRLERNLSKDDILTLYLNQIYFGHGVYGVQEAARFYFGEDVGALGLREAALLAGIVQSPERLSPLKHPDRAKARRAYVIDNMAKAGFIDARAAAEAREAPLGAARHRAGAPDLAPHYVEHVRRQLMDTVGGDLLYTGGLSVHTTLDPRLQAGANAAVVDGLRAVDARKRFVRPRKRLKSESARRAFLKGRGSGPPRPGRIVEGVVTGRNEAGNGWVVAVAPGVEGELRDKDLLRYVRDKAPASELFAPGHVVRVAARSTEGKGPRLRLSPQMGPQAALVCVDADTRHVVAMVGGDPLAPDDFNRAVQARRQPGSSFKPVVYAAALDSRRVHPATIYPDAPEVYDLPDRRWAPQNYDRKFRGPIRLRQALAGSVNMVAIKLLRDTGIEATIDFAHRIGVESKLDPYLPLALGASVMPVIEVANTYAVLASGGRLAAPVFVDRVVGPTGTVLFRNDAEPEQVLDPAVAYLMTDMMTSVVQEGTATRARTLGRPAAGKTGTTNNHTDAWFSGFTPHVVATVWVGFDDNRSLGKGEQGSKTALPIWVDFMKEALRDRPVADFLAPEEGIAVLRIDRESGLLAPEGLPPDRVLEERFLTGTGPTEYAPLPGEVTEDDFLMDQFGFGAPAAAPGAAPPPGVHPAEDGAAPADTPPAGQPLGAVTPSVVHDGGRLPSRRQPLDPEDLPPR